MKYPLFNWNTVPVYIHMCNESGPFNEITNKRLATYPIVTIEKCQGIHSNGSLPLNYSSQYEESKIYDACKALKQINNSVLCIFYLNTILDFTNYYLHIEMVENPTYRLRDDNGKVVYQKGGGGLVPKQPGGFWVFDYQQEIVQNLFISQCINATKLDYVDGCFLDRSQEELIKMNGSNYTFSQSTNDKFTIGHNNVIYEIQKQLNDTNNSISITKENTTSGIAAVQIEGFKANIDELNELKNLSSSGFIVEAHVYGQSYNKCNNIINSLSCFLIGAQKYSYYACSQGWTIGGWPDHEEYHKILGQPIGQATLNGNEWIRKFDANGQNMTVVTWNTQTLIGQIAWSDGTVQIGQNGSVV